MLGAEPAGHRHADYLFLPQRRDGDGRRQGGIDPAGQAQHRAGESALAQIIAQAQHQRLVDRFQSAAGQVHRPGGALLKSPADGNIHHQQVFLKILRLRDDVARLVERHAVAVKDQLIVAPHLVDIHQRPGELAHLR